VLIEVQRHAAAQRPVSFRRAKQKSGRCAAAWRLPLSPLPMPPDAEPQPPDYTNAEEKIFHVGTLTYTKAALAVLFFWLLWGDFCYTVMEGVTGPIMQLKFNELGASNMQIGLILSTIPAIVYAGLNPIVSFKSDRHRGRLGRRIPFILATLPFLVICLIGLGFGAKIGFWVHHRLGLGATPNSAALWTIAVILVAFTFFNSFVTSVFWYLFNDVVPEVLLARFMSWFRLIAMLSASLYQFCIFRFADTHTAAIFVGAALLYLVGFGLMCLNVREGKYPPPPPYVNGRSGLRGAIASYGKECHSHSLYWYMWMATFIGSIGGAGAGAFGLLFLKSIGLDNARIGYLNGTSNVAVAVLILGSGWLADRIHPIRVVRIGVILQLLLVLPASLIWIVWHPSPAMAFWVSMAIALGLTAPVSALVGVWDPPLLMRLFPRERYGQFCSANAIWRAAGGIIGGLLTGVFLDFIARRIGRERAYLYIPVWQIIFAVPGLVLFLLMYNRWKHHGGDESYMPPMVDATPSPATAASPLMEPATAPMGVSESW
jgi:maltose/moltooligosaccharide transporter